MTAVDRSQYVLWLGEIGIEDVPRVGGKNASLGEMIQNLLPKGVRIPNGFALTADAFRRHLAEAGLSETIYERLDRLDPNDVAALAREAEAVRRSIQTAPLPKVVLEEALATYLRLSKEYGEAETDVAVRSSATAEDLPSASFAGQQETFLNVRGAHALDVAIRTCMASLFTDRAIVYRAERGFRHRDVAISIGVQKMVRSDLGSAGVLFTLDPESGFSDVILINSAPGLGELVVQGRVQPDEVWIFKPTLRAGHQAIVRRERGDKATKLVYAKGGTKALEEVRTSNDERSGLSLGDKDALTLARWALSIEEHYSNRLGRWTPMDIEWAKDGRSGELFILQSRPETVYSQRATPRIEIFTRRGEGRVIVRGKSVGHNVGNGRARVIKSPDQLPTFRGGEVLVAEMTDPDWEPVLKKASAVVTEQGGRTCHAAIISRELGLPCVVGAVDATRVLATGEEVTVSCAEGDDGKVYAGAVEFERLEIDPTTLPTPRIPLMVILGNPDRAFSVAQLPSQGVGLVRLEFVISSWIGVHPMALLYPERVPDPAVRAEIAARTRAWASPPEFFVERLAAGIAQIAAAFYPRPIIVRFSDFKTNEYAGLLGGAPFEPVEANPMLGFRGASRYYHERYREAFALECAAVRRVRDEVGLTNVKVMIPFCRTLDEGRRVLAELSLSGLERGKRDLEVWVMCEIPNNVILAEGFADLFDGFSIGSNDLTQLALGVDRDSAVLSHLFDERDPGVKRLIEMVVATAHQKKSRVGICGQAPSDYPELAEWLASIGIDSISLNPDALVEVARRLAPVAGARSTASTERPRAGGR